MKSVNMSLDLFRDFNPAAIAQDEHLLGMLLEALTVRNCQWLQRRPDTPLLYPPQVYLQMGFQPHLPSSGIYYQTEPAGEENFDSWPKILRMGSGDCDDLCCARASELRIRFNDPAARPIFVGTQTAPDYILYHVLVLRGDGQIEDPSLILGMGETADAIREDMSAGIAGECDDCPEEYPTGDDWRWAA